MTSQHSTEETAGTERRPRVRRGIKKRGILPSFGDIVLPIVSIAAVGLLILAGRQFFINGIKSSPSITSTRAYADSPALLAEREREKERAERERERASAVPAVKPVSAEIAVPKDESVVLAEVAPPIPLVADKPANTPAPKKAEPEKPASPAKTAAKSAPVPLNKQWRVQIGAYTSKAGAQEAVKKLKRAGYKATIYQNPASKHFKVWLEGGPTKFYADRIVAKMKQLGYKSSFAFPPAK
ncbi:MAG: SPOR domain-containing protein [Synergistaceae bacterium]|nr:SPOR domain-containing protein [Synergistaceae bacterium]